jgi:hypothetical protein
MGMDHKEPRRNYYPQKNHLSSLFLSMATHWAANRHHASWRKAKDFSWIIQLIVTVMPAVSCLEIISDG